MTELSRWERFRAWISRVFSKTTAYKAELGVGGALTVSGTFLILQEELIKQLLGGLPIGVLIALVVVSAIALPLAAGAIKRWARHHRIDPPQQEDSLVPEPVAELVGRDAELEQLKTMAETKSILGVHGSVGIGTSAVAVKAAWELAEEGSEPLYADLRGADKNRPEPPFSVAQRVTRIVGGKPGEIQEASDAAQKVVGALNGTRRVLLLDNVSSYSQIAWLPQRVQEAYIIVAGTLTGIPSDSPVAYIELEPLDEQARQALLAQHIRDERARREPQALEVLANACMGHPRELVRVGSWLARNRRISLQTIVNDLQGLNIAETLDFVLKRSFDQLKPKAKQAFTLLAELPIAELDSKAIAALLGVPSADDAINELIDMGLVEQVRRKRIRVLRTFRDSGVAEAAGRSPSRVAAWRRLVEYFAGHAAEYARRLPDEQDAKDWFATEDQVLQQVLESRTPDPGTGGALATIADALDTWYRFEGRHQDRLDTAALLAEVAETLKDERLRAAAELRRCSLLLAVGEVREAQQHFNRAAITHGGVEQGPAEQHLAHATLLLAEGDDYKTVEQRLVQYGQALGRSDVLGQAVRLTNVAALLMRKGQTRVMPGVPGAEEIEDEDAQAGGDAPGDGETRQDGREAAAAEARRLYVNARIVLYQALNLAQQAGDDATQAHAHELLGLAHHFLGQRHDADQHLLEAEALYGKSESPLGGERRDRKVDRTGLGRCKVHRAGFLLEDPKHKPAEVAALLAEALEDLPPSGVSRALAHLHLSRLQPEQAGEHREKGLRALAPWEGGSEPQQVKALRELLDPAERSRR